VHAVPVDPQTAAAAAATGEALQVRHQRVYRACVVPFRCVPASCLRFACLARHSLNTSLLLSLVFRCTPELPPFTVFLSLSRTHAL
jgi:hypothetical protein